LLRLEHHLDSGSPLPPNALSADASYLSRFKDASLVCLSLISTSSPAPARYLVRRIRRRAPRAGVRVGLWEPPAMDFGERALATSAQIIALWLRDALSEIDSLPVEENVAAA
jgi:hypothetical protein